MYVTRKVAGWPTRQYFLHVADQSGVKGVKREGVIFTNIAE
jgi:hypothetical protein